MRRFFLPMFLIALGLVVVHVQASADAAIVGSWKGTYDGDAQGSFSMTISQAEDKGLSGSLTVHAEADGGGYTTAFKAVVQDGTTFRMAYDQPDSPGTEVQLVGTLDGTKFQGTWKVVAPGGSTDSTGTFTCSKQ
ncbi:MAG TPA: hypothetical protein VIL35_15160 [Vicinamibacterales bacterium]